MRGRVVGCDNTKLEPSPRREDYQDSTTPCHSSFLKVLFVLVSVLTFEFEGWTFESVLNFLSRNAMLRDVREIALIPIEFQM
jgi:hypothetical protein